MHRFLALLPLALLLAACGGGYGGGRKSSSGPVLQTIRVFEKEYSLTPSTVTVAKPGTYAFEVTNNGKVTHAFTSGDIQPGSHKTVKYTVAAGASYQMYCPIDGHKSQGMVGTIKVGGAAGGGMTTTSQGKTTTSSNPGY
ncbi:MAG: hypothetical protein E6G36_14320 [Actinobacteria bacterium]|nr:MAG: hypothetical protein E6G36_14320 [Actinomycetota bacterium]